MSLKLKTRKSGRSALLLILPVLLSIAAYPAKSSAQTAPSEGNGVVIETNKDVKLEQNPGWD